MHVQFKGASNLELDNDLIAHDEHAHNYLPIRGSVMI